MNPYDKQEAWEDIQITRHTIIEHLEGTQDTHFSTKLLSKSLDFCSSSLTAAAENSEPLLTSTRPTPPITDSLEPPLSAATTAESPQFTAAAPSNLQKQLDDCILGYNLSSRYCLQATSSPSVYVLGILD
ncbi:LOW QUALITY PROTEIN: hypothetical protein M8C21_000884, partial [Ambrosia artemisiifolia]